MNRLRPQAATSSSEDAFRTACYTDLTNLPNSAAGSAVAMITSTIKTQRSYYWREYFLVSNVPSSDVDAVVVLLEDKRPGFAMRPSPNQTPLLNTATTRVLAVDNIPPDNCYASIVADPVLSLKPCIRSVHKIVSSHELYLR
jgi:hypothetical protein